MLAALAEGRASYRARRFRSMGAAFIIGLVTFAASWHYARIAIETHELVETAVTEGEYTWVVTAPSNPISPSECLSASTNGWVTATAGLQHLGVAEFEFNGAEVEIVAYVGDLAVVDRYWTQEARASTSGRVLEHTTSSNIVLRLDDQRTVFEEPQEVATERFPEYSNAVLFQTPLDSVEQCVVEVDPNYSGDYRPIVGGLFSADELVVAPVLDNLELELRPRLQALRSPTVRNIGAIVVTLLVLAPGVVDRREYGLMLTVGWSRIQLITVQALHASQILFLGMIFCLTLLFATGGAAEFNSYGYRSAVLAILFQYSLAFVASGIGAMFWSFRSARALLLAQ